MALPVSGLTAAEAYDLIRVRGRTARDLALQLQVQIAAGTVQTAFALDVANTATAIVTEVAQVRATPGLADYSRAQFGITDPTADIGAMLNATLTALYGIGAAIRAEYPKDGSGYLLDRKFQADGQVAWIDLPAASFPATASAITAFLATLT